MGPYGEPDSVSGIEFAHETGEVCLDGTETDVQFVGYLSVGQTTGDMRQHCFFPLSQGCRWLSRLLLGSTPCECREEAGGYAGADEGVSISRGVNRLD